MANKYTDEYRREAVDYVLNIGKSIKECAGELGLNDKTLSHWVSNFKKEGRTGTGMMARLLGVSRQGFCQWLARDPDPDPWAEFKAAIESCWLESRRIFGARQVLR